MKELGGIGFSEAQGDLLDVATGFCRDRSPMDKVRALIGDDLGYNPAVWREIGEMGWLAIAVPEAHGGVGLGIAEIVPVVEQMGRRMLATPFISTTLAAQALIAGGTVAQAAEILPRLCAGAAATLALTEAAGDWDLARVAATAVRDGDTLRLSGSKFLVCDAAAADWIIVSVLLDGSASLVIVEKAEIPADALHREIIIDETKRSYALTLDGITVPASGLLDPARTAAALAHLQLVANLLVAAEMTGAAQSVIDYTIDYLTTRRQFGNLIGAYQAVKHPTVAAYVGYEKARSHLYGAAHCFNEQGSGEIATRMAAVQAERALAFAADRSIQFHGGFGFTYGCDAQLYRRRAMFSAALFGDEGYQKRKLADLLL
jgi:acyl-CoA dehydrogenase